MGIEVVKQGERITLTMTGIGFECWQELSESELEELVEELVEKHSNSVGFAKALAERVALKLIKDAD